MAENLTFPIVGMHFRPPAAAIVRHLAVNTPLELVPEPNNQFDPNAIAVFVAKTDLFEQNNEKMLLAIQKQHHELSLLDDQIQLGYIPAVDAARLQFDRKLHIIGTFTIRDNKPAVKMTGWKETQ